MSQFFKGYSSPDLKDWKATAPGAACLLFIAAALTLLGELSPLKGGLVMIKVSSGFSGLILGTVALIAFLNSRFVAYRSKRQAQSKSIKVVQTETINYHRGYQRIYGLLSLLWVLFVLLQALGSIEVLPWILAPLPLYIFLFVIGPRIVRWIVDGFRRDGKV